MHVLLRSRVLVFTSLLGTALAAAERPVTFHKDVLPILQHRCQSCHRPGEVAPMSLLTYEESRPWAKAIRAAVVQRKMPPWFADPAHGRFLNDRALSTAEIDTLIAWVDGGALEGDPQEAPQPLKFADGWRIGEPDLVLEVPAEFKIPATGTIPYHYVTFPTGFTEDKWVEKVEIRPGNRSVVHHMIASVQAHNARLEKFAHGKFFDLEGDPNRPGADKTRMFSASPDGELLHVYVPGGVAPVLQPGQARLIKANSDITLQVHYTSIGTPATDRTRIGFVFAKKPPVERVRSALVYNTDFTIPAGQPRASVTAAAQLKADVKIVSLLPHMHLRGQEFTYRAIYPDGNVETLLHVPKYDFNWQINYYLAEPKLLPRGTIIECIGYYDNSVNNPFNPDPKSDVHYGDQTWEEMLNGFMEIAVDPKEPPREIFAPAPRRVNTVEPAPVAARSSAALEIAAVQARAEAQRSVPITFCKDVMPILQKRCQACHRPGEIAPMPFLSYEQVRPWAKAIRTAVVQKKMPPWGADPQHGKFSNDRSLSEEEIKTFVSWADTGAPEGNPGDAPKPVKFEEGWNIGKPDVILQMPKAFKVPATGKVEYQYIVFPSGFTEDKWVERVEIRPGNPAVVHHVNAFASPPGRGAFKDVAKGEFMEFRPQQGKDPDMFSFGKDGSEALHGHAPGGNPTIHKPGQARLVKAGSNIIFQLHYQSNGTEATDQTRIGFVFAKEPPTEKITAITVQNFNFTIPPMVDDYPIKAEALLNIDVKLVSILPHMHLRGKRFEINAHYPDGRSETLIRIPKYDFNWQTTYVLETPKLLPKGTRLEAIGLYDNTPNNPSNPDPKTEVVYGEQTWNEMMGGVMDFAIDPTLESPTIFIRVPREKSKEVSQVGK